MNPRAARNDRLPRRPAPVAAVRAFSRPAVQGAIQASVGALGYDLVEVERLERGLLRVTIDRRPGQIYPTGEGSAVTVDDCEAVTRQLQYALEVEGVDYARLEVSSPGLDRPLRSEADLTRFVGCEVALQLKVPFQGRRAFRGVLGGATPAWRIVFTEGKQEQELGFTLDEVREARLVPVVDFKGRRATNKAADSAPEAQRPDGGQDR